MNQFNVIQAVSSHDTFETYYNMVHYTYMYNIA